TQTTSSATSLASNQASTHAANSKSSPLPKAKPSVNAGTFPPTYSSDLSRSLLNLGRICHSAAWNADKRGVQLSLKPFGPSASMLTELGQAMLADGPKPPIGFSAVIWFSSNGDNVAEITRVEALDCVYNPSRGGEFLRKFSQYAARTPQGGTMPDSTIQTQNLASPSAPAATPPATPTENADVAAMRQFLQVQQEQQQLAAEAEAARQVRAQMCAYLLDAGLAASRLPAPMQDHLR